MREKYYIYNRVVLIKRCTIYNTSSSRAPLMARVPGKKQNKRRQQQQQQRACVLDHTYEESLSPGRWSSRFSGIYIPAASSSQHWRVLAAYKRCCSSRMCVPFHNAQSTFSATRYIRIRACSTFEEEEEAILRSFLYAEF